MIFRKGPVSDLETNLESASAVDLPETLLRTFDLLEDEVIVIDTEDSPLFQSSGIAHLNIIKDGHLFGDEILAIVRAVRRTSKPHQGIVEIPRGPIGQGKRKIKKKPARPDYKRPKYTNKDAVNTSAPGARAIKRSAAIAMPAFVDQIVASHGYESHALVNLDSWWPTT
jgi:hypothetical protein